MGLSLIHAGFLVAGLAVVLPIAIHLLFRQKTRTVPIGSVRFLHQIVREHRRRRRVRQWILLALRVLAVLLLAVLFARPYFDTSSQRGLETEIVFLLDRSASMGARQANNKTALENGLAALRAEIQRLNENVVVHVGLADSTGIEETKVEQLTQAAPTAAATDYELAISWAKDVLAASDRATKHVVLLTDLQATGMPKAIVDHLPANVQFRLVDVGESLSRNLAIVAVEAGRTEIRPDSQVLLRIVVRNNGSLAARQVPLRIKLEGPAGPIDVSRDVDVAGSATSVVEIPLEITEDGLYRGNAAITWDDGLAIDNQRWVAFEARHPDRILLVDGQEGRAVYNNETYFLETALRLQTDVAGGQCGSFEVERIVWEAGEGFPRLDGYRVVVLANVRRMSANDGVRLAEYVQGGGSLLVFAGDQVTKTSVAPLAAHDLLPGELAGSQVGGSTRGGSKLDEDKATAQSISSSGQIAKRTGSLGRANLRISEWDRKHPALARFDDPQHGDMRRVEFRELLPLDRITESSRVLLRSGQHIVAAEREVGNGRVLYFGSSADRDWTDLPRTRLYVPLVRQLLAYLSDQLDNRASVSSQVVSKRGDQPGITNESADGAPCIVTNVDPRESILERTTPAAIYDRFGGQDQIHGNAAAATAAALILPSDSLKEEEIWGIIAWVLLIVLATETLLAGRIHA